MRQVVSGASLKVMICLVLSGLLAGLAPAQQVQVKKLWERTLGADLLASAFDPDVLTFVARTANGLQVFDSTGKDVMVETAPDLQSNDYLPCVFSLNGRFVGFNRNVYSKNYSQLPPPFIIDCLSGRRLLKDVCSNCEIRAISNDGKSILMVKDILYAPDFNIPWYMGRHATVQFCAGDGRVIRELPMYGYQDAVFSGNSQRLVIYIGRMGKADEAHHSAWHPWSLIEFNTQGQEIWRNTDLHLGWFSVADSGEVLSVVKRGDKYFASFYDRNGRMTQEIPIEHFSDPMGAGISADGKKGIIVSFKQRESGSYLLFVDASHSTPLWEKTFSRDIQYDGRFVSASISPGGERILVNLGPNEPTIINADGKTIAGGRYDQPTYFVLGGRGYFLSISGQKLSLNQIVP